MNIYATQSFDGEKWENHYVSSSLAHANTALRVLLDTADLLHENRPMRLVEFSDFDVSAVATNSRNFEVLTRVNFDRLSAPLP